MFVLTIKAKIMKTKNALKLLLVILLNLFVLNSFAQRHHHKPRHHSPHHKYSKLPHWGHSYKVAPRGALVFPYSGVKYHYHGGIFYKPVGARYVIARPPVGLRVRTLPEKHVVVVVEGRRYFYYYGTYYVRTNGNEYTTVAPPVGARVDALPDGYKKVVINGLTYYEFEGTYYEAYIDDSGEVWYEVVGVN